jgi:hypothetical protein
MALIRKLKVWLQPMRINKTKKRNPQSTIKISFEWPMCKICLMTLTQLLGTLRR